MTHASAMAYSSAITYIAVNRQKNIIQQYVVGVNYSPIVVLFLYFYTRTSVSKFLYKFLFTLTTSL